MVERDQNQQPTSIKINQDESASTTSSFEDIKSPYQDDQDSEASYAKYDKDGKEGNSSFQL